MNIVVGGVTLSPQAIYREAQYHPAKSWAEACHEATRALVIRELLLQRAQRDGALPNALNERSEQQVIEALLQRELPVPDVTDSDCQAFYQQNQARFLGPSLFEASHILFALGTSPNADVQAQAGRILDQVRRHPERFERLAREHSACPSGSAGGRLGQLSPGETVREFEEQLERLQPGEIAAELLTTKHGLHIVRLDEHSPGRPLPYELVIDKVRLYLRERSWRAGVRQLVLRLAASAGVDGFDLESTAPAPSETTGAGPTSSGPGADGRRRLRIIS